MLPPAFTVRAVLRTDKKNSKDLCPVSVCVTIGGKRTYLSTGLRISEDQWKDGRVYKHANAALYNTKITKAVNDTEARLLAASAGNINAAKQAVRGEGGGASFIDYAQRGLPQLRNEKTGKPIAYETKRRWGYDLEHVRNYAPNLTFADVTPEWLRKFNKHLLNLKYSNGKHRMEQNSARKTFVFIRRIFNEAKNDGIITYYPFSEWKLPQEKDKPTQYLTFEETDKIRDLLQRRDLSNALRTTIAHFLLECYSGIRHSDWSKWQSERLGEGDLFYLTTTKNNERISIPLSEWPRLSWIINYIRENSLTYSYTNQNANEQLKTVALMAGITKRLNTHIGRHSAATQLSAQGFSKDEIAAVLGITERVAARYAKLTGEKIRNASRRHGGI